MKMKNYRAELASHFLKVKQSIVAIVEKLRHPNIPALNKISYTKIALVPENTV